MSPAVVAASDCPKTFLPSSVPLNIKRTTEMNRAIHNSTKEIPQVVF